MRTLHAEMREDLALSPTDMHKSFDRRAAQGQIALKAEPFFGHVFLFRGERGDLLKGSGGAARA